MTRDRKGQAFVPGFLSAAAGTPIMTAGELPGGGGLFAQHFAAPAEEQLSLPVCPNCGQWQRPDCLNECRRRGFAPSAEAERLAAVAFQALLAPIVHRCGRCGLAEAAGAAGLCAACNELADERGEV